MPKIKPVKPAVIAEFRRGMVGLSFQHWGDKNHDPDGTPVCEVSYRGGNPLRHQTELALKFPWRWKIRLMCRFGNEIEETEIRTGQCIFLKDVDHCLDDHKQTLLISRNTLPDAFGWQATIIGG